MGRLEKLDPELLDRAVAPLMILPDYEASATDCPDTVFAVLNEVLSQARSTLHLVINDRTR